MIVLTAFRPLCYGLDVSADLLSPGPQVREEIYTAFNTIYTVLCEFRKP